MKFFVTKDIRENRSVVGMLLGMSLMILAYTVGNGWLLAESIGTLPADIVVNLLGDSEGFTEPMELSSLVETVHTALFIGSISIMIALAVMLRLSRNDRFNLIVTIGIFGSFLGMYGGLFLIRYASPEWAVPYLGFFWTYHTLMGTVSLYNGYRLLSGGERHGS